MADEDALALDVVFGLAGRSVPAEHAFALAQAVVAWLPWLGGEPAAGVHRLRTAPTGYGMALLAHRAKLVLRVPRPRLSEALALAGRSLDVGGTELAVGSGVVRPLKPWATLHAGQVAAGAGDEAAFQEEVREWLGARALDCEFITGRQRTVRTPEREIVGFSVVLHGLRPAASLRVQDEGMGAHRLLGCGIFVPHKSIAAVG